MHRNIARNLLLAVLGTGDADVPLHPATPDAQVESLCTTLDAGDDVPPSELARRWIGEHAVVSVSFPLSAPGMLFCDDGGWQIGLREGLPLWMREWTIAHELGHLLQRGTRIPLPVEEARADLLAAALLRRCVRRRSA